MAMLARQRGLSLVEVMIGITIALVLTLGLMVLIMGTSRSYQSQDDFARLQENGMTALAYLGDSIRHAGFYGIGNAATTVDATAGAVNTAIDCGSASNPPLANWAFDTIVPMVGFTGLTPANVNATLPCVLASNFQTGQLQVLAVRLATGERLADPNADGNLTDAAFVAGRVYVQGNASGAILFQGSNYGTLRASGVHRTLFGGADAPIFEYQAHLYYVRPCSRTATPPGCLATDDDGLPVPTLVRQELEGLNMVERPLVQGVERVNFLYGVDANADGVPDRFTATPVGVEWTTVVVVRVSVLVRDTRTSFGHNDADKRYDLDGDGVSDFNCTVNVDCAFRRRVFTQNFQVRNVAQRRGG